MNDSNPFLRPHAPDSCLRPGVLFLALAVAGGCAPGWNDPSAGGGVATETQALGNGVPQNGFPNWDERTLLVLVNRDRADPQTALQGCTICKDKDCYGPVPPVGWDYDLNRSARFHSTNLTLSGAPLQHPSPCLLKSNIAQIYPASCDGAPSCACQGTVKCTCSTGCMCPSGEPTCPTQPIERIQMFNPAGCSENIAAGYPDPMATEQGLLLEPCTCCTINCPPPYATCNDGTVNGHRVNILSSGNTLLGTGQAPNGNNGCYQANWYTQDYGCTASGPTKLIAGTHYPQSGTNLTFWANWFDNGSPLEASVVIDGAAHAMNLNRGSAPNNSTWAYQGTVASGCHPYYFSFKDFGSVTYLVPAVGAYLAGDNCTTDYTSGTSGGSSGGNAGTGGSASGGGSGSSGGASAGGSGGDTSDAGLGLVVSAGCACTSTAAGASRAEPLGLCLVLLVRRRRRTPWGLRPRSCN